MRILQSVNILGTKARTSICSKKFSFWALVVVIATQALTGTSAIADHRPVLPNKEKWVTEGSKNFLVHYSAKSTKFTQESAKNTLTILETISAAYSKMGFPNPPTDEKFDHIGDPRFDAYFFPNNERGGAPFDDQLASGPSSSYFYLSDNIGSTDPADYKYHQEILAHEYFHPVQYAFDANELAAPSGWWAENTAEWATHQVFPLEILPGEKMSDIYQTLYKDPMICKNDPVEGCYDGTYQWWPFSEYLSTKYRNNIVLEIWKEQAVLGWRNRVSHARQAIDKVLYDYKTDLESEFVKFAAEFAFPSFGQFKDRFRIEPITYAGGKQEVRLLPWTIHYYAIDLRDSGRTAQIEINGQIADYSSVVLRENNRIRRIIPSKAGTKIKYIVKAGSENTEARLVIANPTDMPAEIAITSTDNRKITYKTDRMYAQINEANIDGLDERVLLARNGGHIFDPSFSRNGKKFTFTNCSGSDCDIYVQDGDGATAKPITSGPASDGQPSISADGSQVVFVSDRDGDWDIYRIDYDGRRLKQLTKSPNDELDPELDSGDTVVFSSDLDGDVEIYSMKIDGSELTQETSNTGNDWSPSISEERIAYVSDRNYEINMTFVGGYNETVQVTSTNKGTGAINGSPSFSPDGKEIAFHSNLDGSWQIYSVPIVTGIHSLRKVTSGSKSHSFPVWRNDSIGSGLPLMPRNLPLRNSLQAPKVKLTRHKQGSEPIPVISSSSRTDKTNNNIQHEYQPGTKPPVYLSDLAKEIYAAKTTVKHEYPVNLPFAVFQPLVTQYEQYIADMNNSQVTRGPNLGRHDWTTHGRTSTTVL